MRVCRYAVSVSMFLWVAVILFLTSGCADNIETGVSATASASEAPSGEDGASPTPRPLLSHAEADMVQFFHFLLRMDEAPETVISQKQAEAMLPVVRKNVEQGTMEETDKQAIVTLLREEQQASYDCWLKQFANRDRPQPQGSPEGMEDPMHEWREDWPKRIVPPEEEQRLSEDQEWKPATSGESWERPGFSDDWAAGEKNVEQQLIELLEGKIKS